MCVCACERERARELGRERKYHVCDVEDDSPCKATAPKIMGERELRRRRRRRGSAPGCVFFRLSDLGVSHAAAEVVSPKRPAAAVDVDVVVVV